MSVENPRWWQKIHRHDLLALILLVLTGLATFAVLILPISLRPSSLPVQAGQVATQDIQAPKSVEYISNVRTEQARDTALRTVALIYSSPDSTIARRQISRLRTALETISTLRSDTSIATAEKRIEMAGIADLTLTTSSIDNILAYSDQRWSMVEQESMRLLELTMRGPIQEDTIDKVRVNFPLLVSFTLNEEQAAVVVELVSPFIVPNSFYDAELTEQARQNARQAVEPITQSYVEGEIVVKRGKVITEADMEALGELGLVRTSDPLFEYVGAVALVAATMSFIGFYFHRRHPSYYNDNRSLILIAVLFLTFLTAARLVIPNRAIIPYVFPLPAFGLLIATLFSPGGALLLSVVISILAPYGISNAPGLPTTLDLTVFYMVASLMGILSLGRAHRIGSFAWAALVSAASGIVILIAYRLPAESLDWVGFPQLIGATLLNGISSASVALMMQYFLAEFLGLTTSMRLLEIARPDAPLLQFFLRNAPGTYQHSLMVANLAEQAAEKLNMDTLLVRVGALYHDVGKAMNATFFIENQVPDNLDPHNDIPVEVAAANVIRHVTDGVLLAKKYRLPSRIIDFMLEHHGTQLARYHYNRAVQLAGGDISKVDASKFRYPGPRPRSRETAILMLADNVEARARSERPRTEEEMHAVVQRAVDACQSDGQLADTRFTFKDLTAITEVFVTTLTGLYHPRIKYPGTEPDIPPEEPTAPAPEKKRKK